MSDLDEIERNVIKFNQILDTEKLFILPYSKVLLLEIFDVYIQQTRKKATTQRWHAKSTKLGNMIQVVKIKLQNQPLGSIGSGPKSE